MAISPRVVDRGATALLAGRVAAPAGVSSVTLEAHPLGALTTIPLGSVPVAADGSFTVRVTPSSTTEYRVRVPATGDYGEGSAGATVAVRRSVQILGASPSVVRSGRVGSRIAVVAAVGPSAAGVRVAFRLERWSTTSRTWRLVGTLNRVDRRRGPGHRRLDAEGKRALPLAGHGRLDARLLDGREPLGPLVDRAVGRGVFGRLPGHRRAVAGRASSLHGPGRAVGRPALALPCVSSPSCPHGGPVDGRAYWFDRRLGTSHGLAASGGNGGGHEQTWTSMARAPRRPGDRRRAPLGTLPHGRHRARRSHHHRRPCQTSPRRATRATAARTTSPRPPPGSSSRGTAQIGSTVKIYAGGVIGTGVTTAGGTYAVTTSVALPSNATNNSITATATSGPDESAHVRPLSQSSTDNTAPGAPSTPDLDRGERYRHVKLGRLHVRHDADLQRDLRGERDRPAPRRRFPVGSVIASGTAWNITSAAVGSGVRLFTATQLDAAGNGPSGPSAALQVTIDTAVPVGAVGA